MKSIFTDISVIWKLAIEHLTQTVTIFGDQCVLKKRGLHPGETICFRPMMVPSISHLNGLLSYFFRVDSWSWELVNPHYPVNLCYFVGLMLQHHFKVESWSVTYKFSICKLAGRDIEKSTNIHPLIHTAWIMLRDGYLLIF